MGANNMALKEINVNNQHVTSIDDEPILDSSNLVISNGIAQKYGDYYETDGYLIKIEKDADDKILNYVKTNGEYSHFTKHNFKEGIQIGDIKEYNEYNPEFVEAKVDKNDNIIFGHDVLGRTYIHNIINPQINKIIENDNERKQDIKDLNDKIGGNWKDKNIWWCGTSIPAAGYWNVNNTWAYPYMTGQNLKAKRIFNEAVGSSCAKYWDGGGTYEVVSRRMGNTISEALAICKDLWTIDDTNQTVSNGPRVKGITAIPNVSSYGDACWQRHLLLCNCYEIKLVSKYLISDSQENELYLRQKFGNLYSTLVSYQPNAYNYQEDIDLFVLDHGHNDGPSPVADSDVDSTDMTTFIGAMNTYIRLIMQYKPHARIVMISDYDNAYSYSKTIEAQKQIAEHWHLPFIDLSNHLPYNVDTKVKVRGYWSTNGRWQETGFKYDPNAESVASAFAENGDAYMCSYLGNTIQSIANHITPEQDSNGIWWYYLEPRYIWIKDGLHPHTDGSGTCLRLYAKVIAEFINQN